MRFQTTLEGAECLSLSDAVTLERLDGKVFQARGAATKNAWSPIVVRVRHESESTFFSLERSNLLHKVIKTPT